jgi:nicotinamide-nucleotide amidase
MSPDPLTTLAALVGAALKAQGEMLATAESCTGGGIAEAVTRVAGSSAWFDRGFVTYSNRAKIESLGVDAGMLARNGAVSEETARAMAQGALAKSAATLSLSVTGVAGPAGGTGEKPVGTVCFAWARKNGQLASGRMLFAGDRDAVRRQSVIHALQGVLDMLDRAQ